MRSLKRLLTVAACTALLVGGAVAPASASSVSFTYPVPAGFYRNVACPHPNLITPYGPMSFCTSGTPGIIENRDIGFYSPVTNGWSDVHRNLSFYGSGTVERKVVATDGVKGTFRGGFLVDTAFGPVSYGIQYSYYIFQPIGRFGNYSTVTGKFHPDPNRPWYEAEHDF